MFRIVPVRPSAIALLLAGLAVPAFAQVNGPAQVYSTAPRAGNPGTGGHVTPPPAVVPPTVVVVPVQSYGTVRSQRPPAIQTAPDVVLGWGGLPPSSGQPAPGYHPAPGQVPPGYVVPGHGHVVQQPGVPYGGQAYPSSPYGQPVPQVVPPPPLYYPAPSR